MAKITMKQLRADVEALTEAGVRSKGDLFTAIPKIVALGDALKIAKKNYDETNAAYKKLGDICGNFAKAHEKMFNEDTLAISPIGVLSGDIDIDGKRYHLAHGFSGFRSTTAEDITQARLAELNPDWVRSKLELYEGAIGKMKITAEQLAEVGIERRPKIAWSEAS